MSVILNQKDFSNLKKWRELIEEFYELADDKEHLKFKWVEFEAVHLESKKEK